MEKIRHIVPQYDLIIHIKGPMCGCKPRKGEDKDGIFYEHFKFCEEEREYKIEFAEESFSTNGK